MNQKLIDELAQKIWNYHLMHHKLEKADCILGLGSQDLRVAQRSAELFLQGLAPLLVFSGGFGSRPAKETWAEPEAEKFARVAIKTGVPKNKILVENKSTNTGENIIFTKKLLAKHKIQVSRLIIVTKPYMEKRAYATFRKNWSEKKVIITSPQLSFQKYCFNKEHKNRVINMMVGDLQRIKIYPKKGFQIFQKIPEGVWQAYQELIKLGYNKQLIKK